MDVTPAPDLENYLASYPASVRDLMLGGRAFLLKRLRPVVELHYDATSAVCAGFAYTGDVKGLIVNLAAYSDHVTMVFNWGAKLDDPEGRLKGGGNQVRHMRLGALTDLEDPYILGLIDQACEIVPHPDGVIERIVTKVYEGPKRRPS